MKEASIVELLFFMKQLLLQFARRWRLLLFLAFVVLLVVVVTRATTAPSYVASVTFIKQQPVLQIKGVATGLTADQVFGDDYLSELFKSKNFVETTLKQPAVWLGSEKLFLDAYWLGDWKTAAELQKKIQRFKGTSKFEAALRVTAEKIIRQNITALREDKQLDYFKISISHTSQKFAYEFCTLLSAYAIQLHTNMYMARVNANRQLLQHSVDSIRRSLYASMYQVASRSDLQINALRQIVRSGVSQKEVEAKINAALYTNVQKQLELARLNTQLAYPLIKVIDRPWLPLQKENPWYNSLWLTALLVFAGANIFSCMYQWDKKFLND